jgi:3-hydroxyacyl-CoA dehydrogenase/enoyl-CoA hydratase/3-hydroxybutyryl-CoA epimerase
MQFIYGTGIEAFLRRADKLAAKYGAGFALDTRAREALKKFQPTY